VVVPVSCLPVPQCPVLMVTILEFNQRLMILKGLQESAWGPITNSGSGLNVLRAFEIS